MTKLILPVMFLFLGTACFKLPNASEGNTSARSTTKRISAVKEEVKSATKFQVNAATETALTVPEVAGLSGAAVAVPPGSLGISVSLIVEQSADFQDTSVAEEVGLTSDIQVSKTTPGLIVRPSEDVELTKPLSLSMPLPSTLNLSHLKLGETAVNLKYAVFYKVFDPTEKKLMAGMKVVDGTHAKLVFDEKTGKDMVAFEGYFGAYWVAELSREVKTVEVPVAKAAVEPIMNHNKVAVVETKGIVKETEIVVKQAIPELVWSKTAVTFEESKRLLIFSATASQLVKLCRADIFESVSAKAGISLEAPLGAQLEFVLEKAEAHTVFARFRCTDGEGRLTVSNWSEALLIPAKPAPVVEPETTLPDPAKEEVAQTPAPAPAPEPTGPLPDTTAPVAPSNVGFAGAVSQSTSFAMSWLDGSDAVGMKHHEVQLCTDAGCSQACINQQNVSISPATMLGAQNQPYYGCVRAVDSSNNASAWVASATTVVVDQAPTVVGVATADIDGYYKAGQYITIAVQFSENVNVTSPSALALALNSGASATYLSGTGSSTLLFRYTIANAEGSGDLDYSSTTALVLGAGTIRDSVGNDAAVTLPAPGSGSSIAGVKAIVVDTTAPSAPTGVAFPLTQSGNLNFQLNWTSGSDSYIKQSNAKICTANNCSSGCGSEVIVGGSTGNTSFTGNDATTYYGCVQAEDLAGNKSAWVPSAASIAIDTSIPNVTNVTTSKVDGTYGVGSNIDINVEFSEIVYASGAGTFGLTLETGTSDRNATYQSGDGTNTLVFRYTVQVGDEATDLDYASINALSVGGGAIKDISNNNAVLTLPTKGGPSSIGGQKAIVIDAVQPMAVNVSSPESAAYFKAGQTVEVRVTFAEPVTVTNSGDLRLKMETGSADTEAVYAGGSGTPVLAFTYTVAAADTSADLEVFSTAALSLGGSGAIQDVHGNDAVLILPFNSGTSLSGQKNIVIDTTLPAIPSAIGFAGSYSSSTSVSMSWTNGSDTNFSTHNTKICMSNDCITSCTSAGTSASTPDTKTGVNGVAYYGCVQSQDLAGNTSAWVASASTVTIDTNLPTVVSVSSNAAGTNFKANDTISIQVQFSEIVNLTGTNDIKLTLETGASDGIANYASGSGTDTISFTYTVSAGESASDLNYHSTTALSKGATGTIKDASGNDATLSLPALGNTSSLAGQEALVVDGVAPTIINVSSTSGAITAGTGTSLPITITFSEQVYLTTAADINLTLETGATDAIVTTPSGHATTTLTFDYLVANGQDVADLDVKTATSLALGSAGAIKDLFGNPANLTVPVGSAPNSLATNKNIIIDTTNPTAPTAVTVPTASASTSVNITWTKGSDANFAQTRVRLCTNAGCSAGCIGEAGNTIESMSITGSAGVSYYACARSMDAASNFSTGWVASANMVAIDMAVPTVDSVSSGKTNGSYKAGELIPITVTFSEVVNVTGTPQLNLETGGTDVNVDYSSGTGTTVLTFNYTVAAGNTSADLDYFSTASLTLNGGTIKDAANNNATLTLPSVGGPNSIAGQKALIIDTTAPTVTNVNTSSGDGYYKTGNGLTVTVTFSELVEVTSGTPSITLEMVADRFANYNSGSNSNILSFNYTIQAGDTSLDLDYVATNSLVGPGIKDAAGNAATLTLPTPGMANSIGANRNIVIDTTMPSSPSGITLSPGSPGNVNVTWTNSSDTNFLTHDLRLCTNNNCAAGCGSDSTDTASPATLAANPGSTVYACVAGKDSATNHTGFVPSASAFTVAPTFGGIATAEVIGSNGINGILRATLQDSAVGAGWYKIFFSTGPTIGSFDFNQPALSSVMYSGGTTIDFEVPSDKLQDGYYVVRAFTTDGMVHDGNNLISTKVQVLRNHDGFVLIPKFLSGLGYDYYIMRYEASYDNATSIGADSVTANPSVKGQCEANFHINGSMWHSSCGTKISAATVKSVPAATALGGAHWNQAYTFCRNSSANGALLRLPTALEWQRAAMVDGSNYNIINTKFSNGTGANCNVNGSAEVTGNRASCTSIFGVHDMAGNLREWVDARMYSYNIAGSSEDRFSFGPNVGRIERNGIDNIQQYIFQTNVPAGGLFLSQGANYTVNNPDRKQFGHEFAVWNADGTGAPQIGFRCVGFRADTMPSMEQLAQPEESKYAMTDFPGGSPGTWNIPDNAYIGQSRWENVKITVTNAGDTVAEGQVEINWKPWMKTTCNMSGTCAPVSNPTLHYRVYRFTEPNRVELRYPTPYAVNVAGSTWASSKALDPLATNSAFNRLYGSSTGDGKLIGSITNCNTTTPANCNFVDSTANASGFSASRLYNYLVVAVDSFGNEAVPMVQRFRSPFFTGDAIGGSPASATWRMEQRFRRAGVFLVDENYQLSKSVPQVMVHVPMDQSGLDHDFFMQKYEAYTASGSIVNGTGQNWPIQTRDSTPWTAAAAKCHASFAKNGTVSSADCGDGTNVNTTTTVAGSKPNMTNITSVSQNAAWRACRNSSAADLDGNTYNFKLPTPAEWNKAADWGDLNYDGTIDVSLYSTNVGATVAARTNGSADTSTPRCHTDYSPTSVYQSGSANTVHCRSRYNAADMVGNLAEWTTGRIESGAGLDNGEDGIWFNVGFPSTSGTYTATSNKFNTVSGIPVTSGPNLGISTDQYNVTISASVMGTYMGGHYNSQTQAGRFNMAITISPDSTNSSTGFRCGL